MTGAARPGGLPWQLGTVVNGYSARIVITTNFAWALPGWGHLWVVLIISSPVVIVRLIRRPAGRRMTT